MQLSQQCMPPAIYRNVDKPAYFFDLQNEAVVTGLYKACSYPSLNNAAVTDLLTQNNETKK